MGESEREGSVLSELNPPQTLNGQTVRVRIVVGVEQGSRQAKTIVTVWQRISKEKRPREGGLQNQHCKKIVADCVNVQSEDPDALYRNSKVMMEHGKCLVMGVGRKARQRQQNEVCALVKTRSKQYVSINQTFPLKVMVTTGQLPVAYRKLLTKGTGARFLLKMESSSEDVEDISTPSIQGPPMATTLISIMAFYDFWITANESSTLIIKS
ncbi:hypothetical protein llap_11921 [Limosa lapponica baueri]|uniref:Uncharacterized protein n=1 Tax=Limosa lapponica baueri TaxID=1758121 RepID=A0A2I0TVD7_LIMLA|nr:hypothetical protein llap_11921 [Limosa lapponica baueri]